MSADQAVALGEALLHLYQAKAESLQCRVNDLLEARGSAATVAESRRELRAVDQTLDQLGWEAGERNGPVEVTATRALLREAVAAAIDEAGNQLSAQCTALLRGDGSAAAVDAGIEGLRALLKLLRETDGA